MAGSRACAPPFRFASSRCARPGPIVGNARLTKGDPKGRRDAEKSAPSCTERGGSPRGVREIYGGSGGDGEDEE